jgi:hypothetical protein
MRRRVARLVLAAVLVAAVGGCAGPAGSPAATATACPATRPNGKAPPDRPATDFDHGDDTGMLFTILSPDGEVVFRPGGPGEKHADGSLEMTWPWCRTSLGEGAVTARRLDGSGPAVPLATIGYGAGFYPTSLRFPGAGCWAVTATSGGATLTFVTLVVDARR